MQYRIKVIEYESGRKEYVPQVRLYPLSEWQKIANVSFCSEKDAIYAIDEYKGELKASQIKSVTYKPVQP